MLKGIGRSITGVVAATTGILTCIAGAPIATMIVAGVSITAGILTLANGIADVQQSATGNNFVRDTVFQGSQNNYDAYASIVEGVAIISGSKCGKYLIDSCTMKGAVPGNTSKVQLQPGEQYIRYGSDYGRYMTTPGTAASSLALPPTNTGNLTVYEVAKAFYADTGIVAPCKWGPGGGTQFFSWRSMQRLIQMGYIVKK